MGFIMPSYMDLPKIVAQLRDANCLSNLRTSERVAVSRRKNKASKYFDYPVQGSEVADALALVRINDYMAEATMKHAGRVVAITRRQITDEGKTLIISYQEPSSEPPVDNQLVYDKQ
jgi:hypothetical protein